MYLSNEQIKKVFQTLLFRVFSLFHFFRLSLYTGPSTLQDPKKRKGNKKYNNMYDKNVGLHVFKNLSPSLIKCHKNVLFTDAIECF